MRTNGVEGPGPGDQARPAIFSNTLPGIRGFRFLGNRQQFLSGRLTWSLGRQPRGRRCGCAPARVSAAHFVSQALGRGTRRVTGFAQKCLSNKQSFNLLLSFISSDLLVSVPLSVSLGTLAGLRSANLQGLL